MGRREARHRDRRPGERHGGETREVRSLDATGKNMSVQTTLEMQHGYDGPTVQGFATGTDVFVKSAP